MCCLFGIIDYNHSLNLKEKNLLLSALATAAEERGTDATGIAYNSGGKLRIYKRPKPGHCMRFLVPKDATVMMGHTRMATQGDHKKNYNNHPFLGHIDGRPFALAHNGMLFNDHRLRRSLHLPDTKIETDSYVCVQLLERKNALDFSSLKYMAEQVEGSFTFTVIDDDNTLSIIKGDNPMCLYHFQRTGLYVYASTEDILKRALLRVRFLREKPKYVDLICGDILRIDACGQVTKGMFNSAWLCSSRYFMRPYNFDWKQTHIQTVDEDALYLEELKSVASMFGYAPEAVDRLIDQGFTPMDIEELLYA